MRYRLTLSYDGSRFSGWQVQPGSPTVQEALEGALTTLLKVPVPVTGAGRTDTGVNASGYIAHFDIPFVLPLSQKDFCYKLNAILPREIVIHGVFPADDSFHARFDAVRREYTYFIHRTKDPFVDSWSWLCGYPDLDFDAMNRAAAILPGRRDFSCFEKTGGSNKTSICEVFEAFWAPYVPSHIAVMGSSVQGAGEDALYWYFRISADRFLRNMVRAVVGTLIEVGRGKRTVESVGELLASGTRSEAGESVPGHALFLSKVLY